MRFKNKSDASQLPKMKRKPSRGRETVMVLVPTYNEKDNIRRIVPEILKQDPRIKILVIDDGSPDGTAKVVKKMMQKQKRLSILERRTKDGLGKAYIAGFRQALENPDVKYITEMDADFSHNPSDLPRLLEKIDSADLVIGSRYSDGVSVVHWPMKRLLLSYMAGVYTRLITGIPVQDVTSGFKIFRRHVLEWIPLDKVFSNGYAFQIEMHYRVHWSGFRITEVPIIFMDRAEGLSKMHRGIVLEALLVVWKLLFVHNKKIKK